MKTNLSLILQANELNELYRTEAIILIDASNRKNCDGQ